MESHIIDPHVDFESLFLYESWHYSLTVYVFVYLFWHYSQRVEVCISTNDLGQRTYGVMMRLTHRGLPMIKLPPQTH